MKGYCLADGLEMNMAAKKVVSLVLTLVELMAV